MLPIAVVALFVIAMSERLADRAGVVAPVLLLVLGTGVAAIPAVPATHADPDIILEVILPGLLHASAVKMPMPEVRRNLGPIATLSVLLVALSAVVVGTVLHTLVPGLGLAAAIALGAVVSPTDAVATSIVRRAGVSQRIIAVLEGARGRPAVDEPGHLGRDLPRARVERLPAHGAPAARGPGRRAGRAADAGRRPGAPARRPGARRRAHARRGQAPFVPAREAQAGRRARPHDGLAQPARAPRLASEPPQGGAPHPAHGAE